MIDLGVKCTFTVFLTITIMLQCIYSAFIEQLGKMCYAYLYIYLIKIFLFVEFLYETVNS